MLDFGHKLGKVEHRDTVAHRARKRVAVGGEHDVPALVHTAAQCRKLHQSQKRVSAQITRLNSTAGVRDTNLEASLHSFASLARSVTASHKKTTSKKEKKSKTRKKEKNGGE